MRKQNSIILLIFLFMAGTLFAQSPIHQSAPNPLKPIGINMSLWKGISTQTTDSIGTTAFNLGFFSLQNNLTGLGINILGSNTSQDVRGIQLAGFSNNVGRRMQGIQLAGITNINKHGYQGLSVAGMVSINGNEGIGILASGLASIIGDNNRGITVSGLMNFIGDNNSGLQLTGIANITGNNYRGLTLSGLMNVAGGSSTGVQAGGLLNITGEDMRGLQLSGIGNVVGGKLRGVQIGLLNMVSYAKGVQIGLFNYYKEKFDGLQLGLFNANPHTRIQLLVSSGNTTKLNLGARFKNNSIYTILGVGAPYFDFNEKLSGAVFYRAGAELPLCKRLFVSGDLGYSHIETFRKDDANCPARLYSLQTRINLEYKLAGNTGLFVSGGYGWDRYYDHNATYDKGIIIEGGIVLFRYTAHRIQ